MSRVPKTFLNRSEVSAMKDIKTSKAYQRCEELFRILIQRGYTYQISRHELKLFIKVFQGTDKRTIRNWIENFVDFDFLVPMRLNVFKVNVNKAPDELVRAVSESGEQGKQMKLL